MLKRKNKAKYILAVLAAFSVLLSSCGKGSSADPAATPKKDRMTVSFSLIDINGGVNNEGEYASRILQRIEDYCDVNLNLIWIANDAVYDRNLLYVSSPKTMPDIMSWGGDLTGDVIAAAKNGAFVDLSKYIFDEEKYPHLSKMSMDVAANLTIDGKLIAIPRSRVVGRFGLSYRADWAEKLNVTLPKRATPEDVYEMLYAFTYGDPDGNGRDDTVGLEMTSYTGPFDIIQTWFGCGNGWQVKDGRLLPVWRCDEYFEAVEYIKRLYDDGLMAKDFAARPTNTWSNGCKTGENGVFIDVLDSGKRIWQYFEAEETKTPSVVNPEETASMVLYGAVNGHTLATSGYNGFFTLSATSLDSDEKIEKVLTFLDRLNEEEMLTITQYGLEGVNYDLVEGVIRDTDTDDVTRANNYKGLNQMLPYLPSAELAVVPVEETKFTIAQNEAYAAALPYAEVNPALSYLASSESYAAIGAALDDAAAELRTRYICGSITLEDFKAGLDRIVEDGYGRIIDEVNRNYMALR